MEQTSGGGRSASASTRPYLIRALHDWCTDNGFTPYIAVHVDRMVQVPMEYVSNNEIVLNVGFDATSGLDLGNDFIQFKARFGGVAREIVVPVDHVVAIYARENGQGMAFPSPAAEAAAAEVEKHPATPAPTPAAPRGATPLRGLRLAPDKGTGQVDEHGAPPASSSGSDSRFGDDDPNNPGGGRPSLKRIK
ncbi:MAG: ClpXP protease specificity-enhancing factor [Burkholderiaceae bacterium]|nr:ClpXP protease specificity-enhancing factor [Burkholderiaceae bacterium]